MKAENLARPGIPGGSSGTRKLRIDRGPAAGQLPDAVIQAQCPVQTKRVHRVHLCQDIAAIHRAKIRLRLDADSPVGRKCRIDIPTSGAESVATVTIQTAFS